MGSTIGGVSAADRSGLTQVFDRSEKYHFVVALTHPNSVNPFGRAEPEIRFGSDHRDVGAQRANAEISGPARRPAR
jgi:hypothetical protein